MCQTGGVFGTIQSFSLSGISSIRGKYFFVRVSNFRCLNTSLSKQNIMESTAVKKPAYTPSMEVLAVNKHWEENVNAMGTVEEAREFSDKRWTALTAEPGGVDYLEVDVNGTEGMWIVPKGCATNRVIICFHGGGYISGSMYTHRKMFAHLAKSVGCRALNLNYSLTPEAKYPTQLNEALKAYKWLLAQGIEAGHIALAGDSAGGHLSLSTLLLIRDEGLPQPAGALTISAWTDMKLSGKSYDENFDKDVLFRRPMAQFLVQLFFSEQASISDPYASPIDASLKGLPPVYMQAGEDEALVDDSRVFAARAKDAGVNVKIDVFPQMLHTFQMTAGRSPEANDAIQRFAQWLKPIFGLK
jgi:monoterpene epsilon-lactone hydrolase